MAKALWTAVLMSGTVIGAGFASGREIAAFFSRYGSWSWAGIATSALLIGLLAPHLIRIEENTARKRIYLLLPGVTAGAMICAGGELAVMALPLPLTGGYVSGAAASAALGWLIARSKRGLAAVSLVMSAALLLVMLLALSLPALPGSYVARDFSPAMPLIRAASYAGFNLALSSPLLRHAAGGLPRKHQLQAAWLAAGILMTLLAAGNAMLLKNPVLMSSSLPLIVRMQSLGRAGYLTVCSVMYLAVMTTLAACIRTLRDDAPAWMFLIPVLSALGGFSAAVDRWYPTLGIIFLASMVIPPAKSEKSG